MDNVYEQMLNGSREMDALRRNKKEILEIKCQYRNEGCLISAQGRLNTDKERNSEIEDSK